MKKTLTALGTVICSLALTSCLEEEAGTADNIETKKTEELQRRAADEVDFPRIVNFQEKKLLKELYELRDQIGVASYSYTYSEYTGKFYFFMKSIGYGLPASVQYSNPERIEEVDVSRGSGTANPAVTIPQPEPNGLFMPEGLLATYLFAPNPITKEAEPIYMETELTVSPFPLPFAVYHEGGPSYEDLVKARQGK